MQPVEEVLALEEKQLNVKESHARKKKWPFTDFVSLILFLCFLVGMVFIAAFAFTYGNPLRLVYGYDSFGNICGMNNNPIGNYSYSGLDMTDKSYLFFLNVHDLSNSLKLCVKVCPSRTLYDQEDLYQFANETGSLLCRYDVPVENYLKADPLTGHDEVRVNGSDNYGPCPKFPVYKSSAVLNRCVPTAAKNIAADIIYNIHGYLNHFDPLEKAFGDLYASRKEISLMGLFACALSILMCVLIYWLARFVFTIFALLVSAASIVGTSLLWWTYADIKRLLDSTPENEILDEVARNETAFLLYSIAASILTLILLIVVHKMSQKLYKVADLFEDASRCLRSVPLLFLQPLITFAALILYLIFWFTVMLAIASASHHTSQNVTLSILGVKWDVIGEYKAFTVIEYGDPTWVRYMWWYYIVALILGCEFILSCQQMVISYTVAEWYFSRNDEMQSTRFLMLKAMNKTFCYHLGSLAKGSFLISIFKIPRLVLIVIEKWYKRCEDNRCGKCCCFVCCRCCLRCLENFIRYIHHNAYAIIAIQRINFCEATKLAYTVLLENPGLVVAVNTAGDFILLLGKLCVTVLTGILGLLAMKHNPQLHLYAVPFIVACIFAFFISHCILSLFEMVVDTLLLCYCEDCHMHGDNPAYAVKSLPTFVRANNLARRDKVMDTELPLLVPSGETSC